MPADKMVSYPMQNNGSLDEEAFFFAQGSAHCGVPRALPFGNPQTFVYKSLTKTSVLHCGQTAFVLSQKVQKANLSAGLPRQKSTAWRCAFLAW